MFFFKDNKTTSYLFLSIELINLTKVVSEPPTEGYGLYIYNFVLTDYLS